MNETTSRDRIRQWEERFATEDYVFGTEPNAFLLSQRHRLAGHQDCLAVADGEGRNGVWLAKQGLRVTSVEASANALVKARRLAEREEVRIAFEQADLLEWPWPAQAYDVVAAIFIQFLAPVERARIFVAMRQALRPGGLLLLQGYTPRQLDYRTGGPPVVEQLYTADVLHGLLGELEVLEMREHDSIIHEGVGHSGMSALIDVVARRPAGA